jgi:ATP-dependent Clp protease ATP-binding subunit ClpC
MESAATPDRFTAATRDVIMRARDSVLKYKHTHITPEHILLSLMDTKDEALTKSMTTSNGTPDQIKMLLQHHLRIGDVVLKEEEITFSERAKRVIETAREESIRAKASQIGPQHLLLGLAMVRNTVAGAVLAAVDLKEDAIRAALT